MKVTNGSLETEFGISGEPPLKNVRCIVLTASATRCNETAINYVKVSRDRSTWYVKHVACKWDLSDCGTRNVPIAIGVGYALQNCLFRMSQRFISLPYIVRKTTRECRTGIVTTSVVEHMVYALSLLPFIGHMTFWQLDDSNYWKCDSRKSILSRKIVWRRFKQPKTSSMPSNVTSAFASQSNRSRDTPTKEQTLQNKLEIQMINTVISKSAYEQSKSISIAQRFHCVEQPVSKIDEKK